jgi:glycosyltransferase involved in cell wall biosynthesis
MKISFVVTHYKEPWEICKPWFDSLKDQLGINFEDIEVLFVEDGGDPIDEEMFAGYPFLIRTFNQGHYGVSAQRNYGLDNAKGDYVMFCDCDDRFISAYAIHLFLKAMKQSQFDVIKTPFLEDQVIDGELKLIRHDNDITFIHGKMYRREFLNDNLIRYDEDLTIHEDSYFNVIANMLAENNIHEMSPAVYLWKYRDDSIVRADRDCYVFKTYDHLMKVRRAITKNLEERERYAEMYQAISKTIMDSYYDFQRPEALKEINRGLISKAEKAFADYYREFKDEYKNVNINDRAQMAYLCRINAFRNGMLIENETLKQFLTRICRTYGI